MIVIKDLIKKDKGRAVVYRSWGGYKIEQGTITSWNDEFIFVRYGWGTTSAATRPIDLEFVYDPEGQGRR